MGSDASSSWTVVKRHNKMDRKLRQLVRPSKALEERIPEGIHVILVGGKPGSGVRTCSIAIQERLALQRIVCERVEDCGFVALTGPCLFCRRNHWNDGCPDAPQALQINLLYKAVEKMI